MKEKRKEGDVFAGISVCDADFGETDSPEAALLLTLSAWFSMLTLGGIGWIMLQVEEGKKRGEDVAEGPDRATIGTACYEVRTAPQRLKTQAEA